MVVSVEALRRIAGAVGAGPAATRLLGWAAHIEAAPAERRDVLLSAVAEAESALACLRPRPDRLEEAAPQYPGISRGLRARLALGAAPTDLAPGLTRGEAHGWLLDGAPDAPVWLLRGLIGAGGLPADASPRSVAVARWLLRCWADPARREALERPRRELMAGRLVEGRYVDRLDELRDRDLAESVEATYRRAGERLRASLERALRSRGEPLSPVPSWWRPLRCARLLRSGADLVAEGHALRHCVASYADAVRARESVIVGLAVVGQRSTAEIDPRDRRVRQHRGPGNREPHPLCVAALAVLCRRWEVAP